MSASIMTPQALNALQEHREQLWSSIDALLEESARLRTELKDLGEAAQFIIEAQRRTIAAIAAERDQLRAELDALRSSNGGAE